MDGVFLHKGLSGLVVAFRLDPLDFCQQVSEQSPQGLVVVYDEVCLSLAYLLLNHLVSQAVFVAPFRDELAVLHVRLGVGTAEFDAAELHHQTVADVAGVFGLVGLGVRHDAELHHLRVGAVVQAEEVGAGFLQGGAVFAEGVGRSAGQQLAGAMPEALVKVGVDLVGDGEILLGEFYLFLVPCKLGQGALGAFLRRVVVCVRDVGYGDALRAMVPADPVGVGEVDADGGGRIAVAGQAGRVDDLCADSLHLRLLEARVDGGVVLEPLCVRA